MQGEQRDPGVGADPASSPPAVLGEFHLQTATTLSPVTSTTATGSIAPTPPQLALPGASRIAGSLLLVIALVFALAFLLKRVQNLRGAAQGGVALRGGLQVGARERVLLIEASGRRLLIGVAPGSVRTLHVFDPGELAALPQNAAASSAPGLPASPAAFAERLRQLLAKSEEKR